MISYIINGVIIAVILIWQLFIFISIRKKISSFKNIFPNSKDSFKLAQGENADLVLGIESEHKHPILDVIITTINNYLNKNRGAVSDFHLMRNIVDRNCDAMEEEIQTQSPALLYLGLSGTMGGILIGLGVFVFGGWLSELLKTGNDLASTSTNIGAEGIEVLLGGVALAMISSIAGIIFTITSSYKERVAKAKVEKNKNTFLSWIQAELLPNISTDTSAALVRMTNNLANFNTAFGENTQDLRSTLGEINDSYTIQADIIRAINDLRIGEIATANIKVYDELRNSTEEIGVFAQYLQNTNEYLQTLQQLSSKLDEYEQRTQVIENAGDFFLRNENWLSTNIDNANIDMQRALNGFTESTKNTLINLETTITSQIVDLNKAMQQQQKNLQQALSSSSNLFTEFYTQTNEAFQRAITAQQSALEEKLEESSILIEELRSLSHIKEGIKNFKESTEKQNKKIDKLTEEIHKLAKIKTEGGKIDYEFTIPRWAKVSIITATSFIGVASLIYISPILIEWINLLIK